MSEQQVSAGLGAVADAPGAKRDNSERPIDFLEPEEFECLAAGLNTRYPTPLRDLCMLDLMHKSGLRISEAVGVRRRDIKWDSHMLVLPETKGGDWRTVPLLDATLRLLVRWDEVRRHNPKLGGQWFFSTHGKGRVDPSHLRRKIKALARKAGLDGIERAHPHALRHSCATGALDRQMSIQEVRDLLGHKNLATTLIYLKARPKGLVDKYRRMMEPGEEG